MNFKIIHILYKASIGGTPRTVYNLIQEQLKNRYQVICIVLQRDGGFLQKYKSLLNENLFLFDINSFRGWVKLYQLLKRFDGNWIIHNHAKNLKLGLILKRLENKKVLTEHLLTDRVKEVNPHDYKKLRLFYFLYEKDYSYITSVSNAVKNALQDEFGINSDRIKVIFNAVEKIHLSKRNDNGSFIIGNATHFEKIKNIDLFISIAEKLINLEKSIKFILVGDGSQKQRFLNFIQEKKFDQNIVLYESQENLSTFFSQLRIGLITSFSESFSLFAAECLTRGIPVIASAVGGLLDVVKNDYCGYLIDSSNKEDFVEKILKLKHDKNIYHVFSENALQYAKKFSVEKIFCDYNNLYNLVKN